jgi:EmrB/QacA subfamily drug resistance transporter
MNAADRRLRIVPLVVACPIFLQNLDTSVMGTALPAIAHSLHSDVLHLNLAITSYLLSLVLFLPASAWLADRFGARRVFCAAVLLFSAASALCGAAHSLGELVLFRLLQGVGGAMMVPVGRLILLRTVPAAQMMVAMVWFTVPGGVGRLVGPLFGGAIVTEMSWRWIFLVNVPFGLAGVLLALHYIERDAPRTAGGAAPLDPWGLVLLAGALGGMLGALEMIGKVALPWPAILAVGCAGVACLAAYLRRSRGQAEPLIDFGILRVDSYRAVVVGAMPLRIAIGATPFLLPLLFQLGFGLSPLQSGFLTLASALGSLTTRGFVRHAVERVGYRGLLLVSGVLTSLFYAVYMTFTAATPHWLIFAVLLLAGSSNSLTLVTLLTVGYSDIPRKRMGHATALASMGQQLSITLGVVLAASLVELTHAFRGGLPGQLAALDFRVAFLAIALMPVISTLGFSRLPRDLRA